MEHIFFEVQLCIKISIFKEISNIDILIILCLLTSLLIAYQYVKIMYGLIALYGPYTIWRKVHPWTVRSVLNPDTAPTRTVRSRSSGQH